MIGYQVKQLSEECLNLLLSDWYDHSHLFGTSSKVKKM